MPSLNGVEFCSQLKQKSFKKIMLTGKAGESVAVQAFNEGIIDKFIRKDSPNFEKTLTVAIEELQHEYFRNLSTVVTDSLAADPNKVQHTSYK